MDIRIYQRDIIFMISPNFLLDNFYNYKFYLTSNKSTLLYEMNDHILIRNVYKILEQIVGTLQHSSIH